MIIDDVIRDYESIYDRDIDYGIVRDAISNIYERRNIGKHCITIQYGILKFLLSCIVYEYKRGNIENLAEIVNEKHSDSIAKSWYTNAWIPRAYPMYRVYVDAITSGKVVSGDILNKAYSRIDELHREMDIELIDEIEYKAIMRDNLGL